VPSLADFVERTVNFTLHDWQRSHLCPILERCRSEKGLRIALHGPPQYGKSIVASQRLPAYLIGCDPLHRVGLACYNETHATGFGQVVRDILLSPAFHETFGDLGIRKEAPAGRFMTSARQAQADAQPSFLAMGLLSGFTGKGVDTLIIDDPYASADDAFSETINDKVWRWWAQTAGVRISEEANVIVMFHRYHEDDFAGRLLATGQFEYVRFPAISDEDRESDPTGRGLGELLSPMRSLEWLRSQEAADPKTFLGQFQGKPRPDEGAFFRREDFREIEEPALDVWVRAWDLAFTAKDSGDWTVGAMMGMTEAGQIVFRNVVRLRGEWADVCELIEATTLNDKAWCESKGAKYHVGIEAVASQSAFFRDLVRKGITGNVPTWPIYFKGADKDKKARASGLQARGRALGIGIANKDRWDYQAFLAEYLAFDGHGLTHDDQVDAGSNGYQLLWELKGGKREEKEPIKPDTQAHIERLGKAAGVGRRR
jgi:hypothetical protein